MKIVHLEKFSSPGHKTSLCLGFFDGVHLGHQKIILETVRDAKSRGYRSALFTFPHHPLSIIRPSLKPLELTNFDERKKLMMASGLDYLIWTEFTESFREITPDEFIRSTLYEKLNAGSIFIGPNYHFGKNGSGNPGMLAEYGKNLGFDVNTIAPIYVGSEMISSTLIRNSISDGNVAKAGEMLGRSYDMTGRVDKISHAAAQFDVLALRIPGSKVLPAPGIYAGYVISAGINMECVVHIGPSPQEVISVAIKSPNPIPRVSEISVLFIDRIGDATFEFFTGPDLAKHSEIAGRIIAQRGSFQ